MAIETVAFIPATAQTSASAHLSLNPNYVACVFVISVTATRYNLG